jgi:predicted house-cleaning noncanonical NTP pyrophosphatase (MazG superfamily)
MAKRIVDKLVRDLIVKQMEAQGKKVTYRHLEHHHEKKEKLVEKLWEKYKELFESLIRNTEGTDHIVESMADMLEVMNKIAHLRDINLSYVMEKKKQKVDEKWWYENFVYIQHVEE